MSRLDQRIEKERVIRLGRKNDLPVIAALDDVLRLAGDNVTGKARHGSSGRKGCAHSRQNIVPGPIFLRRTDVLDFKRISAIGARIQQYQFNRAPVFRITDMRIPVLRHLAHDGLVGQSNNKDIVLVKINRVHADLLYHLKMMHNRFNNKPVFQHQNSA